MSGPLPPPLLLHRGIRAEGPAGIPRGGWTRSARWHFTRPQGPASGNIGGFLCLGPGSPHFPATVVSEQDCSPGTRTRPAWCGSIRKSSSQPSGSRAPGSEKICSGSRGKRLIGRSPTKHIGAPVPSACCLQASPRAPQRAAPYAVRGDGDPQVGQESLLADTAPPPTLVPSCVCPAPKRRPRWARGQEPLESGRVSEPVLPRGPVCVPVCPGPSASRQPRRHHSRFSGQEPRSLESC